MNFALDLGWIIVIMGAVFAAFMAVAMYFIVVLAVSVFQVFWEWVWGQGKDEE